MKTIEITINHPYTEIEWITSVLDSHGIDYHLEVIDHDNITIEKINKIVCRYKGLQPKSLFKKTREQCPTEARQITMYLSREMIKPQPTFAAIAGFYDLDHATAIHACKTIQNLIDTEKQFKQKVENIRNSL